MVLVVYVYVPSLQSTEPLSAALHLKVSNMSMLLKRRLVSWR